MAKVPKSGPLFLRRLNSFVAVDQRKTQTTASMVVKRVNPVAETNSGIDIRSVEQKEIFWMKDPKSGNWIPESHFGEIDVVELREKHLPNSGEKAAL